jgi:hypothetical protein
MRLWTCHKTDYVINIPILFIYQDIRKERTSGFVRIMADRISLRFANSDERLTKISFHIVRDNKLNTEKSLQWRLTPNEWWGNTSTGVNHHNNTLNFRSHCPKTAHNTSSFLFPYTVNLVTYRVPEANERATRFEYCTCYFSLRYFKFYSVSPGKHRHTVFKLTMTVFFQIASYGFFTSMYLRTPFSRDMELRHWIIRSQRCEVTFWPHIQKETDISAYVGGDSDKSHKNGILPSQILIQSSLMITFPHNSIV